MSAQLRMDFGAHVAEFPYPEPCPLAEKCRAGCEGLRAWCTTGQMAAGREPEPWHVALMSGYEQKARGLALKR